MYSIGKFSKITGVSTKALIWYDKIGVLKPVKINPENGYRYYDEDSLQRVFEIKFLQEMDFSIEEIKSLSNEIIENKINQLNNKITFLSMNISLLENLKEEKMKRNLFEAAEKMLNGKWSYHGCTSSFKEAQSVSFYGEKDVNMPKYLFLGDKNLGTDLNEIFGYNANSFHLNEQSFSVFLINYYDTMILYERIYEQEKAVRLHVYSRRSANKEYTSDDILKLQRKYDVLASSKQVPFNQELIGNWEMIDYILESEIEQYNGKIKCERAAHMLSPLFNKLEIVDQNTVYTLGENDEDVQIKFSSNNTRTITRNNSVMKISMDSSSVGNEKFILHNHLANIESRCLYKKIGNTEYLFVDLENDPDLDQEIYVYKKGV